MKELLRNERLLRNHVSVRLRGSSHGIRFPGIRQPGARSAAAVLLLLGIHPVGPEKRTEACLIFNERSRHVRQPGDLCLPGGGLSPFLDGFLAGLLKLPGFPLSRRAPWRQENGYGPSIPSGLSRMLATGLRESFEEMRINPFRILFLGPMAPEYFQRYNRTIFPMVAWNRDQKTFVPNREVERIVPIPLLRFLDNSAYAKMPASDLLRYENRPQDTPEVEYPCLTYNNGNRRELLWGLTFRIVMRFLETVFGFKPPFSSIPPQTTQ